MESDILLWVVWSFGVFMAILAVIPLIRENSKSYNALSHNFIILVGVLAILQAGGFMVDYVFLNSLGYKEPVIPKNLQIDMIVIFGLLAVVLHFTLYALGYRRHYGLPWIWYIFIIMYFIQLGSTQIDAPIISSAVIAGVLVVLFFYKAFKNRSGLMLGIAIYILINLVFGILNQYVAVGTLATETCDVLAFLFGNIALALATWDVYDRYVLYDRAREKAIKSTWISKIMQVSKKSTPITMSSKVDDNNAKQITIQRQITCPVCKASNTWHIADEVIEMRNTSTKGVILVSVPAGTTCDHDYGVYINQGFEILGYKNS